ALAAEHRVAVVVGQQLAGLVAVLRRGALRDARLAEVLLRKDVDRDLAPPGRHVDVACLEHQRAVGVPDLRVPLGERDPLVRRLALDREPTSDLHATSSWRLVAPPARTASLTTDPVLRR